MSATTPLTDPVVLDQMIRIAKRSETADRLTEILDRDETNEERGDHAIAAGA